eukprot:EG_transcript_21574
MALMLRRVVCVGLQAHSRAFSAASASAATVPPNFRLRRKLSAFNVFLADRVSKEVPLKAASAAWATLGSKDKQTYKVRAEEANKSRPLVPKKVLVLLKTSPRKVTAQEAFLKAALPGAPGATAAEKRQNAARAWATLDAQEKARYEAVAAEAKPPATRVRRLWVPMEQVKLPPLPSPAQPKAAPAKAKPKTAKAKAKARTAVRAARSITLAKPKAKAKANARFVSPKAKATTRIRAV